MRVGAQWGDGRRAISHGAGRSVTVTRGHPAPQVRPYNSPDGTDSQADSAGSIPVTRSSVRAQVRGLSARPGLIGRGHQIPSGPLASRDQHANRTVLIVPASRLLGLDVRVDRVRDRLVSALGLVLVDHRGSFAVVPHPGHQVPEPYAAVGGELIPGVAQIMEIQAGHAYRRDRVWPCGHLVEVAPPQRTTLGIREDERARVVFGEDGQVLAAWPAAKGRSLSQFSHGLTGRYGNIAPLPDTGQDSDLQIRILAHWPDRLH